MALVPVVLENTQKGERSWDIFSRLLKDRIIFVTGEIEDNMASLIVAQLLFLDAEDKEKDIYLYINSRRQCYSRNGDYRHNDLINPDNLLFVLEVVLLMRSNDYLKGQKEKDLFCLIVIMIHQPLGRNKRAKQQTLEFTQIIWRE